MTDNKNILQDKPYQLICKFYSIASIDELKKLLNNTYGPPIYSEETNRVVKPDIILPFSGKINYSCCKAVVYNHGLYTQCSKLTNDNTCKSCAKLKYGTIENRIKNNTNEFVSPDGKKEVPYHKFVVKMGYNMSDVKEALDMAGIIYAIGGDTGEPIKKGRGRPKKIPLPNDEDDALNKLEVTTVNIDGSIYFKTEKNVLLNVKTYEVVGTFIDNKFALID